MNRATSLMMYFLKPNQKSWHQINNANTKKMGLLCLLSLDSIVYLRKTFKNLCTLTFSLITMDPKPESPLFFLYCGSLTYITVVILQIPFQFVLNWRRKISAFSGRASKPINILFFSGWVIYKYVVLQSHMIYNVFKVLLFF